MYDSEIEDVDSFGARARAWIVKHLPVADATEDHGAYDDNEGSRLEQARGLQLQIFEAGFAGIVYPRQYGGQGLTREHQLAWRKAAIGYQLPTQFNITHGILGPTLLEYGSEAQKAAHLPAMLRGEELWVQCLSEPSGGSDLAGLLTRAVRERDVYRINGSKIWTSRAHLSDFAMVLVRTNVDVPKHQGLSMLMMSLRSPGVTVCPIRLATGGSYFCQEFFDDAMIPVDHLIGEENDGWRVAMRLLFHERNVVGGNSFNDPPYAGSGEESEDDLIALARLVGRDQDPYTRQLLAEALVLRRLAPSAVDRVNAHLRAGTMPSSGPALLKLMTSLSQYRSREIAIEIGGTRVALAGIDDPAGIHGLRWLGARTRTLAGGSNEMLRNQISERVLGLPPEPNLDKNIPFSEVLARRFHPGQAPSASG